MSDQGLYCLDTMAENGTNLNRVSTKSSRYSACDFSLGINTIKLHDIIVCPGIEQLLEIMDGGIPNCPMQSE